MSACFYECTWSSNQVAEVHPNPTTSTLQLTSANLWEDKISITDMSGNGVAFDAIDAKTIDVSALHPGLYTIHIVSKKYKSTTTRFVKK
ncbi:T9SS type A sorting domain-containing protein [Pseudochryseolinea flava]|nr:T9SS type A sorting domain-containing protein [Pseudochryseolinea flava]